MTPALKTEASKQGLTIDSITVQTSAPDAVNTSISGHLVADVPASFTITETVGLEAVPDALSQQLVPAVLATASSSSVGSLLGWFVGVYIPLIGGLLAFAFYKVSTAAGEKSGLASTLLAGIPSRIPFGNKAISAPAGALPDFPTLVLSKKQIRPMESA